MKRLSGIVTSEMSPIEVAWLPGAGPGRVGLTLAPGKIATSKFGHRWARDLEADLDRLVNHHGARVLICLLEDRELLRLQIPDLIERAEAKGLTVHRLPIPDGGVLPSAEPVSEIVDRIEAHAEAGRNVVIHCAGGLGRAGTIGGCWLVRRGMIAADAIETLHECRSSHCPETRSQEAFIAGFENNRPHQPASSALSRPPPRWKARGARRSRRGVGIVSVIGGGAGREESTVLLLHEHGRR